MSNDDLVVQLRDVANEMRSWSGRLDGEIRPTVDPVIDAAADVSKGWSGSNLGYHARVYYRNLAPAPAGAHFSQEWGFIQAFSQRTMGDWVEYSRDDVLKAIYKKAGSPDLSGAEQLSMEARRAFSEAQSQVVSILGTALQERNDAYIAKLQAEVEELAPMTEHDAVRIQLPRGEFMSRDTLAVTAGLAPAPHQEVLGRAAAIKSPFSQSEELAVRADRAAAHLDRAGSRRSRTLGPTEGFIFIGHGGSPMWRELKDFIQDRLGLPWDEFNRVPVAGVTNIERLIQMMDEAAMAFLVLTADDEKTDGALIARQNVVHEAGLFQGRLGFSRSIVMLEEGCEEFSNIAGLGQIRFPSGKIDAAFEEVRLVLEREGLLSA